MSRSAERLVLAILAIPLIFSILACSPKFDWRTIKNDTLSYTALFPGKPQSIERTISYQQQSLKQFLEFVKIDDDVFAIMTTQIPAEMTNQVQSIEQMLQAVLLQQSGQTNQADFYRIKDVNIRVGSSAEAKQATKDYYLNLPDSKRVMRIRWVIRPGLDNSINLYQISTIRSSAAKSSTPESLLEQENINIFFDEFRPN